MYMIKNLEVIAADYLRMWNESKDQIAVGAIEPDPVPDNSSRRWGVSIIFRHTEPVLSKLIAAVNEIKSFVGDGHIIYDLSNLHTTIRSIEFQRLEVDEHDPKVLQYEKALKAVAAKCNTIKISYKGLTANRSCVIAQGWPIDNVLQEIREAFHQELEKRGLLGGPEETSVRQTSHASLVVFTHPLKNPQGLVEYIERNRETNFGSCEIDTIELVRYRRTEDAVRLVVFSKERLQKNTRKDL